MYIFYILSIRNDFSNDYSRYFTVLLGVNVSCSRKQHTDPAEDLVFQ